MQVLRDSGSGYQIIAQSRVQQPGADGILEINHPGGGCWSGDPQHLTGKPAAAFPYTPDMRPGDVAKGTSAPCQNTGQANETYSDRVRQGTTVTFDGCKPSPEKRMRVLIGRRR